MFRSLWVCIKNKLHANKHHAISAVEGAQPEISRYWEQNNENVYFTHLQLTFIWTCVRQTLSKVVWKKNKNSEPLNY